MSSIDLSALRVTANKLAMSDVTIHTIVKTYLDSAGDRKGSGDSVYAHEYGKGWYLVGYKVRGIKNLPDDVSII